jgi:Tol biopolymer transport system component
MRALLSVAILAAAASPPLDERQALVAIQSHGDHPAVPTVDVSADGRFVTFESTARLSEAAENPHSDIYVLDRTTGTIVLETAAGDLATGSSAFPRLSGDGRYLVFTSLVASRSGDMPGRQVYMKDRANQRTVLVSRTPTGAPGNGWSGGPHISDDGQAVAFESSATDLIPGADRNGPGRDVFVFDTRRQTLERIDVDSPGVQPSTSKSFDASLSGDGRYVAFTTLVALDQRGTTQLLQAPGHHELHVCVHDVARATTRLVSRAVDGHKSNGSSFHPSISADGRLVAFSSTASNLGTRDKNKLDDVYLHDLEASRSTLVSRSAGGSGADGPSSHPALSSDGRVVVFVSRASNLACARRCRSEARDLNLVEDIYRADTSTGEILRISGMGGEQWWEGSVGPAVDATGRVIAFSTRHAISDSDTDADFDLRVEMLPVSGRPASVSAQGRR